MADEMEWDRQMDRQVAVGRRTAVGRQVAVQVDTGKDTVSEVGGKLRQGLMGQLEWVGQ